MQTVVSKLVFLLSSISFLMLALGGNDGAYANSFVLPLGFIIFFSISNKYLNLRYNAGLLIFTVVAFIRYVVMPMLIQIYGPSTGFGIEPSNQNISTGIYISMIEILTITIIFILVKKLFYEETVVKTKYNLSDIKTIQAFLLICVLVLLAKPGVLLSSYDFIFQPSSREDVDSVKIGFESIIIDCGRYVFSMYCLFFFLKKYRETQNALYIFLSYLGVLPALLFVFAGGRYTVAVAGIIILYLMNRAYPESRNINVAFIVMVSITGIVVLTISEGTAAIFDPGSLLQMYFSGPRNIAQVLNMEAVAANQLSVKTFINDIFANIPLIGQMFDPADRTNVYFNRYVLGIGNAASQIIPMSGQSYLYFGVLGSGLFSNFFFLLTMYFDKKARETRDVFKLFILMYASIWCGALFMYNIQTELAFFFNYFFILAILFNSKAWIKRIYA